VTLFVMCVKERTRSAEGSLDFWLICIYLAAAGLEVRVGIGRSINPELLNQACLKFDRRYRNGKPPVYGEPMESWISVFDINV
jgi:hypothetical protein